ncbi:MAG: hypothetical protein ACR5KX_03405 [Wolbachia sp.]
MCKIEDVTVKGVPNLIDAENHVPGSRNTISDLVNEPATSSRAVNEAGSKQLENPKVPAANSHKKNAVDKGKNIMNNRDASTKHLVRNNCKVGEMGNDNKNKSIKEKFSGAIKSIDPDTVERLLNQEGTNITESILKEALGQARKRTRNSKESGKKKQSQENRLTKIIELLEAKLKSIGGAAPSVDDSATTGSQVTPAAEPKESEEDPTRFIITFTTEFCKWA